MPPAVIVNKEDWLEKASCASVSDDVVEMFFSPLIGHIRAAQQICFDCAVRPECAEYTEYVEQSSAVANMNGVFAGFTATERVAARKNNIPLRQLTEVYVDESRHGRHAK